MQWATLDETPSMPPASIIDNCPMHAMSSPLALRALARGLFYLGSPLGEPYIYRSSNLNRTIPAGQYPWRLTDTFERVYSRTQANEFRSHRRELQQTFVPGGARQNAERGSKKTYAAALGNDNHNRAFGAHGA